MGEVPLDDCRRGQELQNAIRDAWSWSMSRRIAVLLCAIAISFSIQWSHDAISRQKTILKISTTLWSWPERPFLRLSE
jgi:hypothetical protein